MNILHELKEIFFGDSFVIKITIGIVILLAIALGLSFKSEREWAKFKAEHNCKVVGHMSGSVGTGFGPTIGGNGGMSVVVTSTPGKTGWLCDDGQTYWR